jgi:hypothetical protein
MKIALVALCGLSVFTFSFAADGDWFTAPDGYVWPTDATTQPDGDTQLAYAALPEAVRTYLTEQCFPQKPPAHVYVRRADIDGDSTPEWFVDRPEMGGTGGGIYEILQIRAKKAHLIGAVQGGFHLCVPAKGQKWLRIEGSSKAGGGHFTRYLLQFTKHEYETVRNEDHDYIAKNATVR